MTDPKGSDPKDPGVAEAATQTGAGASRRSRMGRGLRILLFVSLALNLAVIGLVAGFLARAPFDGPPPRPDRVAGALTFALSEDERREIGREVFRTLRAERDGERRSRRGEYARILAALRADPYDGAVVADSLTRQMRDAMRLQAAGQQALLTHLEQMTVAERQAFADRLAEGLKRFDDRDGHPRPSGRDAPPRD